MKNRATIARTNVRIARTIWGNIPKAAISSLRTLSQEHALLVALGDLQLLDGRWYITHSGLLRMALRNRCLGISTTVQTRLCEPGANRWVFKAVVYKSPFGSRGFVGYGDADPTNVSSLVHGAEMRVAETRAVNRARRKAYGIGLCSVEEIGTIPNPVEKLPPQNAKGNGNGAGPKVRDRLCQIIRRHQLDPELVKTYAIDFCGAKTLREASREQVENFVQQLAADRAESDRSGLLGQLNSYAHAKEGGAA